MGLLLVGMADDSPALSAAMFDYGYRANSLMDEGNLSPNVEWILCG